MVVDEFDVERIMLRKYSQKNKEYRIIREAYEKGVQLFLNIYILL
jgi:hypothetical protein